MKHVLRTTALYGTLVLAMHAQAQRYLTEVFTDAQITITPNVTYATNIDFLTSTLSSPQVPADLTELHTLVATGQPIPTPYYTPSDQSTAIKVKDLQFDVYQPDQAIDTVSGRPVVLYLHTGNALPPPINGSPNGLRTDSTAVEICKRMARRGYVAISMSYRLGWNPLAPTEEERRGQLLNAIYRALHDVRQCIRGLKKNAAEEGNTYDICSDRIIVLGEGTGGYIALANATLDHPSELYIEKFLPDPFEPTVSYVDSNMVGNINGFGGQLNLYLPNGYDHSTQFCVNMGGALADTSWMDPGDVPMVAFHTVFDPYAPFTEGIVIVPTTQGPVVPVQGSNLFEVLVNAYGNNASFAGLPDGDPFTDRARSLYGTTQVHSGSTVNINTGTEGLFAFVTPDWPGMNPQLREEASPWQFWDPNSPLALAEVMPGVTAHTASMASNPNMSPEKARAYIDTVMGYMNPRIMAALQLDQPCDLMIPDCLGVPGGTALPGTPCDDSDPNTLDDTWSEGCDCVGIPDAIAENQGLSASVTLMPNPVHDQVTITSSKARILGYELYDATGRRVRTANVNADRFTLPRTGLQAGAYFIILRFEQGNVTRKLALD
ncbi:MAG TPA: T9SS type A sorting domain-containing protein [Flavobacteriales bacterium]|nr:T9SS type A sorting domain-containing protein [Flavobacteriales bacterium]HMU15095.1 T9SS type A sorting domain-containing protein [Flavobacteriales bacterium]